MESWLTFLRPLHGFVGLIALVMAPLAMVVKKGGDWHRLWGRVYFWSMAGVSLSAALMCMVTENILMLLVAVFSFHMAASGYRALYLKDLHKGLKPGMWDMVLHGSAGLVNAGMFIWGVAHLLLGHRGAWPVIFTVFGTVGLLLVVSQVRRFYTTRQDKQQWLYSHMVGFLASYIATVSAFSAVNLDMIRPVALQWLWPTVLGSPLIALWVRYYQGRMAGPRKPRLLGRARIK